jgi:hypothetical protein
MMFKYFGNIYRIQTKIFAYRYNEFSGVDYASIATQSISNRAIISFETVGQYDSTKRGVQFMLHLTPVEFDLLPVLIFPASNDDVNSIESTNIILPIYSDGHSVQLWYPLIINSSRINWYFYLTINHNQGLINSQQEYLLSGQSIDSSIAYRFGAIFLF